jgi:hypothetical protein
MHAPARADDPAQEDVRRWFLGLGSEARLPLVTGFHEEGVNSGTFCALAPVSYREEALKGPGWNLMRGSHGPGFMVERGETDAEITTYLSNGSAPVEPLVIDRTFHGVRPSYRELAQEFRLFHNLFADPGSGRFWKFDDAGNETLAGELAADDVWVLTSLVRQYQAARQLDLLLFIDSGVYFDNALPVPESQEWISDELNARLTVGEADGRPLSRYLATRILPPPPIEASGMWPFEVADTYFPDFIIGTDDLGNPIRYTCDPDQLANYFGANPDAPNYLTPVHFRREVLGKYFNRPELYRVEDSYLRCGDLWGLRMDNDSADTVIVWLGDLGLYLPTAERDYWRSFNVGPTRAISDSTYRRAILGEFASSESDDLRFRSIYRRLDRAWMARFGWPLFRAPEPGDAHLLDAVRLPLHDSEAELEDAVRTLTKLLVDSLNEAEIARALPPGPEEERGISKLARWLKETGYPETDRDIAFLRGLQAVRSKGTAHRKGSGYEKALDRTFGDKRKGEAVHDLLRRAVTMLDGLLAFAVPDEGT